MKNMLIFVSSFAVMSGLFVYIAAQKFILDYMLAFILMLIYFMLFRVIWIWIEGRFGEEGLQGHLLWIGLRMMGLALIVLFASQLKMFDFESLILSILLAYCGFLFYDIAQLSCFSK